MSGKSALCAAAVLIAALLAGLIGGVAVAGAAGATGAASGTMGAVDGDVDVEALLAEARRHFDFARMDAVLLLDETRIDALPAGGLRTVIHRIVWIGTKLAVDTYADLRVPYRADRGTLSVQTLRTWRDGRWWPHPSDVSPTAVVETLPGALTQAYDYTGLRETMLLHDGVEIPCVVETRYTIERSGPPERGHDGLWIAAQDDPCLDAALSISVPAGQRLRYALRNGLAEPEQPSAGMYVWRTGPVARLPRPLTAQPAERAPCVVWSTWASWSDLGRACAAEFGETTSLGPALADTLAAAIAREPDARGRAQAVADAVERWTRAVPYDEGFWFGEARPADRTWETAYGHALDRAVLAAGLFRAAGLEARPFYRARVRGAIDASVPARSWFDGVRLAARGTDPEAPFQADYDPRAGQLHAGPVEAAGRVIWYPDDASTPPAAPPVPAPTSFELILTLAPGADSTWTGSGYLRATGALAPYAEMVGVGREACDHLAAVAAALNGATITDHNVAELAPDRVVAGFALEWKPEKADDQGRTRLELGDPAGGLMARMPSDVHLYNARRESPVILDQPLRQRVELRLKLGERKTAYVPEAAEQVTGAGRCAVTVERRGEWLHIVREIRIEATDLPAAQWPDLRELLLAETGPRNRTVLLARD
jgi:hypothetical protein